MKNLILLGASNLTRGFSVAIQLVNELFLGPVNIIVAMGHGRSYGVSTVVFGRELPGIEDCGLWQKLAKIDRAANYAVMTDIGNDIMYGAPVEKILQWVGTQITRLIQMDSHLIVVLLPEKSIRRLKKRQYQLMSSILFPNNNITYEYALDCICRVNSGLRNLAEENDAHVIVPDVTWYGWDTIHIHTKQTSLAWSLIFAPWSSKNDHQTSSITKNWPKPPHLWRCQAEDHKLLGRNIHVNQPAVTLPNGNMCYFY